MKFILTFVFIFIYLNFSVSSGDINGKKLFCQPTKKINYDHYDKYPFNFGEILNYYAYDFGYKEIHYYYFLRDRDKILFRKKNSNKYTINEKHIEWFENWSNQNYHNKLNRKTLILRSRGNNQTTFFQCENLTPSEWNNKKTEVLEYLQKKYDNKRIKNKI